MQSGAHVWFAATRGVGSVERRGQSSWKNAEGSAWTSLVVQRLVIINPTAPVIAKLVDTWDRDRI